MKNQKVLFLIISLFVVLLLSLNIYYIVSKNKVNNNPSTGFYFIDPEVLDLDNYLATKEEYTISYQPLKAKIEKIVSNSTGHFGVYFEDLTIHSWIGINEKEYFTPASLLKITTAVAILKEIEEGELSLQEQVLLTNKHIDTGFGNLYNYKGSIFTIEELLKISLIYSDNTAIKALHDYLTLDRWEEARLAMGLPLVSVNQSAAGIELTPKQFSNVFKSLYYSGYLSRSSSNWILSLLSQTVFKTGIPAGVPKDVLVSHKIGVWINNGESVGSVNDCGIVYTKNPYILCIMSENVTSEEGNRVIEEISRTVYNYVSNKK
ncbi:serine hydrolase [Candidatus Pacearchaeota archaeon]|jgi:beta-lactamase class A|nr:serine hydrolase [Candidatus Pacearchaeota archaeon]